MITQTGVETVKKPIFEYFCDGCRQKITAYPFIEVEVTYKRYEYDGDQGNTWHVCSYKCLKEIAINLGG